MNQGITTVTVPGNNKVNSMLRSANMNQVPSRNVAPQIIMQAQRTRARGVQLSTA